MWLPVLRDPTPGFATQGFDPAVFEFFFSDPIVDVREPCVGPSHLLRPRQLSAALALPGQSFTEWRWVPAPEGSVLPLSCAQDKSPVSLGRRGWVASPWA